MKRCENKKCNKVIKLSAFKRPKRVKFCSSVCNQIINGYTVAKRKIMRTRWRIKNKEKIRNDARKFYRENLTLGIDRRQVMRKPKKPPFLSLAHGHVFNKTVYDSLDKKFGKQERGDERRWSIK